ncbi:TetR/AcrR family transcriptional regulator [Agromyces protaetiae]|nr:TetR/AcrR family transcriptional regulator [Agromyces protaetiae]
MSFTELGVQQIAAEAQVARSTFYAHFEDKADLLMRLAVGTMGESFDLTSAWAPDDGFDALAQTFVRVVAVFREHSSVLRAIAEVSTYDGAVREFWGEQLSRFVGSTVAGIDAERDAGRTPGSVDAEISGRLIVVAGQHAIVDHIMRRDPAEDASFAWELAATWWYGVYRRP